MMCTYEFEVQLREYQKLLASSKEFDIQKMLAISTKRLTS